MATLHRWNRFYCFAFIVFTCLQLEALAVHDGDVRYAEISTDNGKIRGRMNTTLFGENPFYSFLGIPYAEKPINDLRFKVNNEKTFFRCLLGINTFKFHLFFNFY